MRRIILTEEEKMKRRLAKDQEKDVIRAMKRRETAKRLKTLINTLQKDIEIKRLDSAQANSMSEDLGKLGFKYNDGKFPPLPDPDKFKDTSKDAPETLAEAMLWKLVRWKAYKNFVANFKNAGLRPNKKTDVVLFAFAKHLKNRAYPIYDQHSLRALWACGVLDERESEICKSVLFDKKDRWKATGSGTNCINAYEIFCEHITKLAESNGGITNEQLDRTLMPLGQAIKKIAKSHKEFLDLCGKGV